MNDVRLGYCTNVHAGTTYEQIVENLEQYSLSVKQAFSPDSPMGIGLWFSADAISQMNDPRLVDQFCNWLQANGLFPFTFNAFPYSDFHQPIVKQRVYEPTWAEASRLEYTLAIARLQAALLPPGEFGSVSTLPLGWPTKMKPGFLEACSGNLRRCAEGLEKIYAETGRRIFLCIEPEPGCVLDTSEDLVRFFNEYLLFGGDADMVRSFIGVCHDVCHSAVMFEPQSVALSNFADHEIHVGKFQISSAIQIDFDGFSEAEKTARLNSLSRFAEDRYLHQTMVRTSDGSLEFFEDLPTAIDKFSVCPIGQWRVHFHVPIFADQVADLGTTRDDISDCLANVAASKWPVHYEVETYAWTVLPQSMQPDSLAAGIAREMKSFKEMLAGGRAVS